MKDADIHKVVKILKSEYERWKKPIVTRVAERDRKPFKVLISCLLSLRTRDETTAKASGKLFSRAETPDEMLELPEDNIAEIIYPVGFYNTKAKRIREICSLLLEQYDGKVPDKLDKLLELPGVGRKTANLVITLGFSKKGICVDTHVHRISNRLGYSDTETPEKTEFALRDKLPEKYWIIFNDLLVTYGQNICTPVSPKCSECRIFDYCERNGVTQSR